MKINIKSLSDFDQNYLIKNGKFSTLDEHGNDRNVGQDKIGRQDFKGQDQRFENALSAVTHEIVRRAMDKKLHVIAIYNINDFVTNLNQGFAKTRLKRVIAKVVKEFIEGKEFALLLTEEETNYNLDATDMVVVPTQGFSTSNEYNKYLDKELTLTQNALINFNIYYNPLHVEYYENYHKGKYDWCCDYLLKRKDLLTLEHTPTQFKEAAKRTLDMLGE